MVSIGARYVHETEAPRHNADERGESHGRPETGQEAVLVQGSGGAAGSAIDGDGCRERRIVVARVR